MLLSPRRVWIWLPLAAILALPAAAGDLARLRPAGDHLAWEPATRQGSYQLTVAGPGFHSSRLSDAGGPLELALFDTEGQPLADGVYTWQLTLMPGVVEGDWHDPANGRDGRRPLAERPELPQRVPTQVGFFTVAGGRLVAPDAVESGGRRSDRDADKP